MIAGKRFASAAIVPLAATVLAACAGPGRSAGTAVLAGRVTFRGAPVPGATVTLHDRFRQGDRHAAAAVRSGEDGAFRAQAPQGTYFVEAEGVFEGTPVFAFSGQNPLRLDGRGRWLGLKAVAKEAPETAAGPPGRGASVAGLVLFRGTPVDNAYVYVYPGPEGLFKGMGIAMSPPTGADGRFAVDGLPESSYFLVARRRGGGGMTGPLEQGDLYGYHPANPVYLRDGTATALRIETVEKEKPLSYADVTSGSETVLRGRVVDRQGRPQEGLYAFAYEDRVFGHQRPDAHSGRTGPDGTFVIYADHPGLLYLGARENFGNSPRPGERFGFYEGTPDHAVDATRGGPVDGLVIVVDRILPEKP